MRLALIPILPLLFAAASTSAREARLHLPEGLHAQAAVYAVSGLSPRRHGEPVRIGPYSALALREGDRFGGEIPLGRPVLRGLDQAWAFTEIALGQAPVQVQCNARARALVRGDADSSLSVDLDALRKYPVLACGFRVDGEDVQALSLHRSGGRLEGSTTGTGTAYRIRSLHALQGTPLRSGTPAGYEIRRGERVMMVVDRLNAGAVAMDADLPPDERVSLAALASALLMFDPGFDGH